jgi:RND family efflux transporter MFP subunit
VVIVLLATLAIPLWRAITRRPKAPSSAAAALEPATPPLPVAVARACRGDLYNEVTLLAEFRPYLQVELHAKVSGYLEQINVDIGDKVKAGQLLAKLEVPELNDELNRAIATLNRVTADHLDAHRVYNRLLKVQSANPSLVAQQDLDAAQAKDAATEAAIGAAKAEVEKYQTLLGYTRITAPFDGVITRRYADPGALIQAGTASDTQSLPLVRLSHNYHLRLDFPVSVVHVKDIRLGEPVEVHVESLGGKAFTGTISRCSEKVDEDTRTMLTEVEVPNPNLELVPGMYANLALKVEHRTQVLVIPTEAVSAGPKSTVYVVNRDQEIEERPVTLGLETPDKYEVVSGLKEGDLVLLGSRSKVRPGQKVDAKLTNSLAQE